MICDGRGCSVIAHLNCYFSAGSQDANDTISDIEHWHCENCGGLPRHMHPRPRAAKRTRVSFDPVLPTPMATTSAQAVPTTHPSGGWGGYWPIRTAMPPSANGKGKEAMDIENKMSGQPAPGRTHGRNIRFCGVGYPCGLLLRGICGVFAGSNPAETNPAKYQSGTPHTELSGGGCKIWGGILEEFRVRANLLDLARDRSRLPGLTRQGESTPSKDQRPQRCQRPAAACTIDVLRGGSCLRLLSRRSFARKTAKSSASSTL